MPLSFVLAVIVAGIYGLVVAFLALPRKQDEPIEAERKAQVDAAFRTTGRKVLHPGFNRRFQ